MKLSDLIISHPEVDSFNKLVDLVVRLADSGERFIEMDLKPDYRDTPRGWELKIESAFYWGNTIIDRPKS